MTFPGHGPDPSRGCPPCHGEGVTTMRLTLLLLAALSLSGCGLVALPFRVTGDIIQVVPVVGKPLGAPVHAIGDAID